MRYDEERLYVPAAQIRSYKLLEEPRRAYFRTVWKAFCSFQLVTSKLSSSTCDEALREETSNLVEWIIQNPCWPILPNKLWCFISVEMDIH